MDPKYDNPDKDVRMFLMAADGAANRGDYDRQSELLAKARAIVERTRKESTESQEKMMPKFRKKPVVIEATQWNRGDPPVEGMEAEDSGPPSVFFIRTLEGKMRVNDGDWIITGIKGEKYPCKPDIFKATYEPVEEQEKMK